MIKVCANGKSFELDDGATVVDALGVLGIKNQKYIAVEQNGAIVPSDAFAGTVLSDGDILEVITPMGGG